MEMKWHPIVNGDLSEVPRDEDVIFTLFNKNKREYYTEIGVVNQFSLGCGYVNGGSINVPVELANIKAWMELPEPFEPGRCDMCKHNEQWTDCFGDRWSKCKFSERMFTKGCPTEKEVD